MHPQFVVANFDHKVSEILSGCYLYSSLLDAAAVCIVLSYTHAEFVMHLNHVDTNYPNLNIPVSECYHVVATSLVLSLVDYIFTVHILASTLDFLNSGCLPVW